MTTKIELLTKKILLLGVALAFMRVEDWWVLMGVGGSNLPT